MLQIATAVAELAFVVEAASTTLPAAAAAAAEVRIVVVEGLVVAEAGRIALEVVLLTVVGRQAAEQ